MQPVTPRHITASSWSEPHSLTRFTSLTHKDRSAEIKLKWRARSSPNSQCPPAWQPGWCGVFVEEEEEEEGRGCGDGGGGGGGARGTGTGTVAAAGVGGECGLRRRAALRLHASFPGASGTGSA